MDIIFIHQLKTEAIIGIYDWERENKQTLVLDLKLGTNIRAAARTEDISQTIDYKTISDRLLAFIAQSEFLLVETMAEQLAELLQTEFAIPWLWLRLAKPDAVPQAAAVGVEIERGQKTDGYSY